MSSLRETLRSWWVLLFFLCCGICLELALGGQKAEFSKLKEQWSRLTEEKEALLAIQEDLKLQINSQSDPAWVELTLMRKLGLVPEGQTKVFFH